MCVNPEDPRRFDTVDLTVKELAAARTSAALGRTALDASIDEWIVHIEKTYGALAAEVTRAGADRFFPRIASASTGAAEEQVTAPTAV